MRRLATMSTGARVANGKGTPFSANPVLAVNLPLWRSRFVLGILFLALLVIAGRAVWLQGISTKFLQKQGEARYVRTLELPATRGKIVDRNGLVLASSIPVKSIWGIPEDVKEAPKEKLRALAKLMGLSDHDLAKKLDSEKGFVYLKRQADEEVAEAVLKLGIPGIQTRKEYKRFYPEGATAAHVVGFTNIEDVGQESMELAYEKSLAGVAGNRRVIKDRLGHIVEDIQAIREPRDGKDLVLSIDNRLQFIAYTQLKAAVETHKAKAGGIVVLDVKTGEVLALANWPSYNPNDRHALNGSQLRNRVITDTYEPGSTMKPITVALALEKGIAKPTTKIQTAPGKMSIGNATIGDAHAHEVLTVEEVIEKSSNIGVVKLALQMQPQDMWEMFYHGGVWTTAADRLSWCRCRPGAPLRIVACDRAGNDELRTWHICIAYPDGACLHDIRAERRHYPRYVSQDRQLSNRPASDFRKNRPCHAQDDGNGCGTRGNSAQSTSAGISRRRQNGYKS